MKNNGNFAPLKLLYTDIWKHKDRSKIIGKTPDMTIQERVQRDARFTRIAKGVYALTDFIEKAEKNDLGVFTFNKNEVVFKEINNTEKFAKLKIRIGQNSFRNNLIAEMRKCPITGIDDKRLLIASHIKPWVYSNHEERMNIKNGLLLSPLFDKLFDKGIGLVTFTFDKKILIPNKLSKENVARLNIQSNQIIDNLDMNGREEFLDFHRTRIFQG
jgi:putative restriction endonuclease